MRGSNLKQAVESLFTVIKDRSSTDEVCFICPQPGCGDTTGNRSVNLKNGKTSCWRCNKGGDFVTWARFLGYTVKDDGVVAIRPIEEMDFRGRVQEESPLPVISDIRLPEGFVPCDPKRYSVYTELIMEMAVRKNLTPADFFEAGVGYTKAASRWEKFAIFPVKEYGRTVYFQGRTYCDVPGESTKQFPTRQEAPYSAKYWVYNIDAAREPGVHAVIAMESILNVLSMRWYMRELGVTDVVPVCIFKHYLSSPQARKLLAIPNIKEVCLLYDHDALRSSWEKSPMIGDRINVSVAQMPPGPGGKKNDPNDDVEAAWTAFEQRIRSDSISVLATQVNSLGEQPEARVRRKRQVSDEINPLENRGL